MDQKIFDAVVSQLADAPALRMKSLVVSDQSGVLRQEFMSTPSPTDLRSISKLAVSLSIGVAISSGVRLRDEPLSLDMPIAPFFERYSEGLPHASKENLAAVRLRHLLSNTMGHRSGFLFRKDVQAQDPASLLGYIFAQPIEFPPGSHFSYSNVGWYLVSAMVRNELDISLSQWVSELLFSKLDITEFSWMKYGHYEAAATGLVLASTDVHKLGELLLADGMREGKQLIPGDWVDTIRRPVVTASSGYDPSSPLQAYAYGYGIWVCENGTYYCDGSGGQFLIVVPERRLVITALAQEGDTLTVSRCLGGILQG
jgi:CubicO group peptidase (beta-lactamase class C family)